MFVADTFVRGGFPRGAPVSGNPGISLTFLRYAVVVRIPGLVVVVFKPDHRKYPTIDNPRASGHSRRRAACNSTTTSSSCVAPKSR